MTNYCNRYCFIGLEELKKKQKDNDYYEGYGNSQNYVTFNTNQIQTLMPHVACKSCMKRESIKINPQQEEISLKCQICNENHSIQTKIWKFLMKDSDGGCCSIY